MSEITQRRLVREIPRWRCSTAAIGFVLVALASGVARAEDDGAAPSGGDNVQISFSTTGSVIVDFTFRHSADTHHFCALTTQGWAHAQVNGQSMEVPPSPPSYELRYDAGERRAAQHFHLLSAAYHLGETAHSDPSSDWIDFWADGDEWLGHGGNADPAFKFEITFEKDGRGGSFIAHHLRAARDGKVSPGSETVDVKGEWQCPLGSAQSPN